MERRTRHARRAVPIQPHGPQTAAQGRAALLFQVPRVARPLFIGAADGALEGRARRAPIYVLTCTFPPTAPPTRGGGARQGASILQANLAQATVAQNEDM
ncbi:hypothetical protein, partial [Streptomyces sp. NPDC013489]|uniref:hypothetical protein n=1 Tax=Streptomyces sp. NPDC013489 TaxID=3155606 RepID=UPI0033F1C736